MPTIGIVDDDAKARESDVRSINTHLRSKGWKAIGTHPLPHLKEYPSWIAENEIAALLIDQKLGGKSSGTAGHVNYEGDDVVKSVRQRNKTLPMYFLTNYSGDRSVTRRVTDVEGIFNKTVFRKIAASSLSVLLVKEGSISILLKNS